MDTGDRTVKVFGEAFFDVAAKSSHPFKVRAREMLVEVLGTRFNVRDYPGETYSQTFVNAGAIRVSYHDSSAILRAGEEADIDPTRLNDRAFILKQGIDTTAMTEWTKGILSFNDVDLRSLVGELSRAYDVDIELQGPIITHRFKGWISVKKEPLDQVIERLIIPYVNILISRSGKRHLTITVRS
jgi:ferric-dicitrate binding protein FerR (iron transport regulator)